MYGISCAAWVDGTTAGSLRPMSESQQCRDAVAAQAVKFEHEADLLGIQLDRIFEDVANLDRTELAVSQAKRVRRESNFLVQALARLRDHLQPEEAQGK